MTLGKPMRFRLKAACLAVLIAVLAEISPAAALDYPNRPITLLVPYAPGGGNDAMARIVADIDREETKWSAIVRKSGAKAE
jgi:tripartite-type tricarboxylate transporter receptor subunit TctC